MNLLYCLKCHKVFFYELIAQNPRWCPNCSDGRYHAGLREDLVFSEDIELKPVHD